MVIVEFGAADFPGGNRKGIRR